MSLPAQKNWYTSWPLALAISALLMAVMYGMVPYTFRYNIPEPISLLHILWLFWSGDPDWQHAGLVFPISLGLIYWQREKFLNIPVRGDNSALAIFFVAFFLYWVGYKGDIKPFAFASIQLMIAGFIVWFFGWQMLKALLFPWAFLFFAWPLPGIIDNVAFYLREFMSAFTCHFLNLIGVPTLLVGTAVVSAPDFHNNLHAGQRFQLDVADPCSGIYSLFALTMVTALYAYVALPKSWQKWVLFLCSPPLAILGNFIRLVMLTFGTILFGAQFAIGSEEKPSTFHMFAGFAVFGAALVGMLFVSWLLELDWKRILTKDKTPAPIESKKSTPAPSPSTPTITTAQFSFWHSTVPLAFGLLVVAICLLQGRPKNSSEAGVVLNLPEKVGAYYGIKEGASEVEKLRLPQDTLIERKSYSDLEGDTIQCSIVLSGVERRSIHRPEICLPAQGWTIQSRRNVPVQLASGKTLYVKELTLGRDATVGFNRTQHIQAIFYYWFVGKNITTPEHFYRVFYSSWDLMAHNINHRWAYVSVISAVSDTYDPRGKSLEQTRDMLQKFIHDSVTQYQISEMSPEAIQEASAH